MSKANSMYNKLLLAAAMLYALAVPMAHAAGNQTANATNSSVPSSPLIGIFRTNQTASVQSTTANTTLTTTAATTAANANAASAPASNPTASAPILVTVGVAIAAAVAYGYYGDRKSRKARR